MVPNLPKSTVLAASVWNSKAGNPTLTTSDETNAIGNSGPTLVQMTPTQASKAAGARMVNISATSWNIDTTGVLQNREYNPNGADTFTNPTH